MTGPAQDDRPILAGNVRLASQVIRIGERSYPAVEYDFVDPAGKTIVKVALLLEHEAMRNLAEMTARAAAQAVVNSGG